MDRYKRGRAHWLYKLTVQISKYLYLNSFLEYKRAGKLSYIQGDSFLLLMKAQITRRIESLHIFSLRSPSTVQTLIYFSHFTLLSFLVLKFWGFFLPSQLLQQLEMTGVPHSIIPICFWISILSRFQPQIFYYLNCCFLRHFRGKKKDKKFQ